jgi:hypothetical protein
MSVLTETVIARGVSMSVYQGKYDLTADALEIRGCRVLHCGDDYTFIFTLMASDTVPKDLTGATVVFTAKYYYADADSESIVQKTGTVTDEKGGIVKIELVHGDVTGPNHVLGYYDLQVQIGTVVETWLYGDIEFLPDVTRSTT